MILNEQTYHQYYLNGPFALIVNHFPSSQIVVYYYYCAMTLNGTSYHPNALATKWAATKKKNVNNNNRIINSNLAKYAI